jgi:hypothetical protein
MPKQRQPSGREMRRCILNQLGETPEGMTQGLLVWHYSRCRLPEEVSPREMSRFIQQITDMRVGGRTMARRADTIILVHQQSPHGWLAWLQAKQEEEANGGRTLAWDAAQEERRDSQRVAS